MVTNASVYQSHTFSWALRTQHNSPLRQTFPPLFLAVTLCFSCSITSTASRFQGRSLPLAGYHHGIFAYDVKSLACATFPNPTLDNTHESTRVSPQHLKDLPKMSLVTSRDLWPHGSTSQLYGQWTFQTAEAEKEDVAAKMKVSTEPLAAPVDSLAT
ncbi:unnamed protein product [Rhizoctonia solani]|uniref:Uncharacterized protein n=1 Tax=Rhizoctonia solani TaxID=456999 RepID=A0A8H2WME4_9AGAM|nr:unnamed protein product [Rhizoctonia solani]